MVIQLIEIAWLGMIIIIISWIVQIISVSKGKKQILSSFLVLQALGILLLVVSDFITNSNISILGILNILSVLGALISLIFVIKK